MLRKIIFKVQYLFSKRQKEEFNYQFNVDPFIALLKDRSLSYAYFHHYFWNLAPKWLVNHRLYYKQNNRGFGEDAFHAMWLYILMNYDVKTALEIGVYRGQTISLWALISEKINKAIDILAISPFNSAGDKVSIYASNLDYYEDTLTNFKYFNLKIPVFHKGFSTDETILDKVKDLHFDLIYIDGNHDYDIVKKDFNNFSKLINTGGLIVFDDSALYTDYLPPIYSSKGHPGPSKLTDELDADLFFEVLSVGHNRVFQKRSK